MYILHAIVFSRSLKNKPEKLLASPGMARAFRIQGDGEESYYRMMIRRREKIEGSISGYKFQ